MRCRQQIRQDKLGLMIWRLLALKICRQWLRHFWHVAVMIHVPDCKMPGVVDFCLNRCWGVSLQPLSEWGFVVDEVALVFSPSDLWSLSANFSYKKSITNETQDVIRSTDGEGQDEYNWPSYEQHGLVGDRDRLHKRKRLLPVCSMCCWCRDRKKGTGGWRRLYLECEPSRFAFRDKTNVLHCWIKVSQHLVRMQQLHSTVGLKVDIGRGRCWWSEELFQHFRSSLQNLKSFW